MSWRGAPDGHLVEIPVAAPTLSLLWPLIRQVFPQDHGQALLTQVEELPPAPL